MKIKLPVLSNCKTETISETTPASFCLFEFFSNNILQNYLFVSFSRIWTKIVRVEGKDADYQATTHYLANLIF